MKALYNPPFLIKRLFPEFIWETKNRRVLLTFDDGPNPGTTEIILKKLSGHKIKALFFCVGSNIEKYPELFKIILDEGHAAGNHTFNHKRITALNKEETLEELGKTNRLVYEKFNYKMSFFRPPYGRFNFNTAGLMNTAGMKNVMWSLLTYDFKNDFDRVRFAAEKYIKDNSIIVLHDNSKCGGIISDSIEITAETVFKKGFSFGESTDCLK